MVNEALLSGGYVSDGSDAAVVVPGGIGFAGGVATHVRRYAAGYEERGMAWSSSGGGCLCP